MAASRTATGAVIGWGMAALVGGPVAAVILMVTLVGIPLGLYLLAALGVLSFSATPRRPGFWGG